MKLKAISLDQMKLAIVVCALLLILLCCFAFFMVKQWQSDWQLVHEKPVAQQAQRRDNTAELIASLPDTHLFGKSFAKIGDVPLTNLQLLVTGIAKVNFEKAGSISKVYISIGGDTSKIYQVGDALVDGVKIYAINTNEVILENDGRLEKLPLPREKLEFKPVTKKGTFDV